MREFREGFIAGAAQRADPGDMPRDWKRGWNAGRGAYAETMRHEERRQERGRRVCGNCGKQFDPQSPTAVSGKGTWFCCAECAVVGVSERRPHV
jgi:hypothetical protein